MNKPETVPELLQRYANFFRVKRNDGRYRLLKEAIQKVITPEEYTALVIEEGHIDADSCSPDAFDDEIVKLKKRYSTTKG